MKRNLVRNSFMFMVMALDLDAIIIAAWHLESKALSWLSVVEIRLSWMSMHRCAGFEKSFLSLGWSNAANADGFLADSRRYTDMWFREINAAQANSRRKAGCLSQICKLRMLQVKLYWKNRVTNPSLSKSHQTSSASLHPRTQQHRMPNMYPNINPPPLPQTMPQNVAPPKAQQASRCWNLHRFWNGFMSQLDLEIAACLDREWKVTPQNSSSHP